MWICGNDALAKDLVQETFLRAWRALHSLKDDKAAKSWLITILRREYARTFERKVPQFTDVEKVSIPDTDELTPEEKTERELLHKGMFSLSGLNDDQVQAQEEKSGRKTELSMANLKQNLTVDDHNTAAGVIARSESMVEKKFAPSNAAKSNSPFLVANAMNFDVMTLLQ